MRDLPGKFVGLILAIILCIFVPFEVTSVETELVNRRLIVEDMRDYIDSIIDGRIVSSADTKAFEAKLASYGVILDYDITHYQRMVNPDPLTSDSYFVTYVELDDGADYSKGDKVSLHVYQLSSSTTGNLAHTLTGVFLGNFDVTITARVR